MSDLLIPNVTRVQNYGNERIKKAETQEASDDFSKLLSEKINAQSDFFEPLKFSTHAKTRMESRQIELTPDEFKKMNEGIDVARGKGIDQTLVLTDSAAFIVSAKNETIITAIDKGENNLFTNIQGTLIV